MYIKVKATTKAKTEILKQIKPDSFIISVKEKAERNQANKRILEILANRFKVPVNSVQIINGHHQPTKLIKINK